MPILGQIPKPGFKLETKSVLAVCCQGLRSYDAKHDKGITVSPTRLNGAVPLLGDRSGCPHRQALPSKKV